MINLDYQITLAQIAFALIVIAFSVAYYVFNIKGKNPKRKK